MVAGIGDTFALGLLNEVIGLKLPIVVAPYAKPSVAAHPVFERNLRALREWGVAVLENEIIRPTSGRTNAEHAFNWSPVVDALACGSDSRSCGSDSRG